jgi:hypothetical protein
MTITSVDIARIFAKDAVEKSVEKFVDRSSCSETMT